jgi:hypothetical protein
MHTTLALTPAQSALLAQHATAVKDMNRPPSNTTFPLELLGLRDKILDIVDREGLIVISDFTGDYNQVMIYALNFSWTRIKRASLTTAAWCMAARPSRRTFRRVTGI